jgi:hypothetical protein
VVRVETVIAEPQFIGRVSECADASDIGLILGLAKPCVACDDGKELTARLRV